MAGFLMGLRGDDGEWLGYLLGYDPDYQPEGYDGPVSGFVDVTNDPARAKRFDHPGDVHDLWRQQSTTVPHRPDGEPNRPLTRFTVEIVPVGSQPLDV